MKNIPIEHVLKEVSPRQVKSRIKEIRNLDLESTSIEQLKDSLMLLVQCGFNIVTFPKGLPIFRCRSLRDNPIIRSISEISYPPTLDPSRLNRASTGQYQIFYGAAHRMINNNQFGHVAGTFEVSELHKPDYPHKIEYLAFSRWVLSEDMRVVVVGLDSSITPNNPEALALKDFRTEILSSLPKRFEVVNLAAEFLSGEFSKVIKNTFEYKISAAFGELLFEMGFQAIMFPSVQTKGHSFNIAIAKDVVDQNMKCEVAAIARNQKIGEEFYIDYFLVSETIKKDATFNWTEPPASATMDNFKRNLLTKQARSRNIS